MQAFARNIVSSVGRNAVNYRGQVMLAKAKRFARQHACTAASSSVADGRISQFGPDFNCDA